MGKFTQEDLDRKLDEFANYQRQMIEKRMATQNAGKILEDMTDFMKCFKTINSRIPRNVKTIGDLSEVLMGDYRGTKSQFDKIIRPAIEEYLKLALAVGCEDDYEYAERLDGFDRAKENFRSGDAISAFIIECGLGDIDLDILKEKAKDLDNINKQAEEALSTRIEEFAHKNQLNENDISFLKGQWYSPASQNKVAMQREHFEAQDAASAFRKELDKVNHEAIVMNDDREVLLDRKEFTVKQIDAINDIYKEHLNQSSPFLKQFQETTKAMSLCYENKQKIPNIIGNAERVYNTSPGATATETAIDGDLTKFELNNKDFSSQIKKAVQVVNPKSNSTFLKGLTSLFKSFGNMFKQLKDNILKPLSSQAKLK